MFDEPQTNQTQSNNQGGVPTLGMNPASPFGGSPSGQPAQTPVPDVVLPSAPNHDESHGHPAENGNHPAVTAPLNEDLEQIKNHALQQLSPLVHTLDQTPEEKYKTLMMMIQASDNQDLLSEAYEAAQKITDDKAKAEALLNIVNEINYFAQKGQ